VTPEQIFEDTMTRVRMRGPVSRLGLAVSGGGDSMALLRLAVEWAAKLGVKPAVATVDHGLRPEAADEAQFVAQTCTQLGVPHFVLTVTAPIEGNLQQAARYARYDLLADWFDQEKLDAIALGHTQDDQAETFVMRLLGRGSLKR